MKPILIVDDDRNFIDLYCLLIKKRFIHASITSARNGIEALKAIKGNNYSFILSDIEMPKMSGIELHQRLKNDFPLLASKMGFITGNCCPDHLSYFREEGLPYLMKPFKKKAFFFTLEKIAASDRDYPVKKSINPPVRKHKRFPFSAEGRLLSSALQEAVIPGEVLNFSEGGFAFLFKRGNLTEKEKVKVFVHALKIENREAEMVWARRESNRMIAGFKWLENY